MWFRRSAFVLAIGLLASLSLAQKHSATNQWFTSPNGSLLQIGYGAASNQPQYGVLDLNSSYLRLNYGPGSGWGTSIDTMPCYWSGGALFQGYPVTASAQVSGKNLVISVTGTSNTLTTHETITINPPANNAITATVSATTSGTVTLDNRPGEAFKPVFLSSMHDSPTVFDSSNAFVGSSPYAFPSGGWVVGPTPPVTGSSFGLTGGTSTWKTNAPTVTITFKSAVQVAGWLTTDTNPNDDNVGFWAAASVVPNSWTYQIRASQVGSGP